MRLVIALSSDNVTDTNETKDEGGSEPVAIVRLARVEYKMADKEAQADEFKQQHWGR